jgi:biopolymer transport protein ExbD
MHGGGGGSIGGVRKARVEIIPLIDVMFFLLASFIMVSLTMQRTQVLRMDLPSAVAARSSSKPDVFNIEINQAGDISVDKKPYPLPQMGEELVRRFTANTNLPVYIKADPKVYQGRVITVLDEVKSKGIAKVSFAIDPPK